MTKLKLPVGGNNPVKNKATKKAGGPVSLKDASTGSGDSIKVSDKYAEQERRYKAEDAARTLARAQEIKKDKALMKDVKGHIKNMAKACE